MTSARVSSFPYSVAPKGELVFPDYESLVDELPASQALLAKEQEPFVEGLPPTLGYYIVIGISDINGAELPALLCNIVADADNVAMLTFVDASYQPAFPEVFAEDHEVAHFGPLKPEDFIEAFRAVYGPDASL